MKIFSVHDNKADAYLTPFFMKTTGEAIRGFQTACQDNKSQFNLYPHDFTLVELGDYLETNAGITCLPAPRILSNASEFVKIANQSQISQILKPAIQELETVN